MLSGIVIPCAQVLFVLHIAVLVASGVGKHVFKLVNLFLCTDS